MLNSKFTTDLISYKSKQNKAVKKRIKCESREKRVVKDANHSKEKRNKAKQS